MGALHEGHLALVRRAVKENGVAACSIFVNPIQFNNPDDLAKYPNTLEADLALLQAAGCHMVFAPSAEEMYPAPVTERFDFGPLERVMEGVHRPGHFNGVAIVVEKLFRIVEPDHAYFGEKDFQQLRIIQTLVDMKRLSARIIPCPTVREEDGLAMSSRNRRLSEAERRIAPEIYRTLVMVREEACGADLGALKSKAARRLADAGFIVEYYEIASSYTLQPLSRWEKNALPRALVAAWLGNVRLIDNLELIC